MILFLMKIIRITLIALVIISLANSGCLWEEKSKTKLSKPGDYAKDYLKDDRYTKIIVEIDYVSNYPPSDEALNTLYDRIDTYTDKENIFIDRSDSFQAADTSYSVRDMEELEEKYRNLENTEDTIVIYIIYLNGQFSEDSNVLGLAYSASSFAIFKERIDDIDIPLWARLLGAGTEDFEKSVVVHEFGHLLALVNIGYESNAEHEDAEHPHHCTETDCVMYYAVEGSGIVNMINTGSPTPPNDYCDYCKDDLRKLKGS